MNKKILLIEDDLDIQRVYKLKLATGGFEVILAAESQQGFQLAKTKHPNLILLDIMLPGKMNGFELLKKLKESEETKNIPVLVLTNLSTEKKSALSEGAVDYLVKAETDVALILEKVRKYAR